MAGGYYLGVEAGHRVRGCVHGDGAAVTLVLVLPLPARAHNARRGG